MKRTILILAIFIAAATSVFGQAKDEQAIRQYFDELDAMLVKDQAGAIRQMTSDDYVFVNTGGAKLNKAGQIETIKNSTWTFASTRRDIESIHQSGDLAVVISHLKFTGKDKVTGVPFNGGFGQTVTLQKRDGRWTAIAAQSVREIPPVEEAELNKFIDGYTAALRKNAADEAAKFLGTHYTRIGSGGSVGTKDEYLAAIRAGNLKYGSIEITDRRWRVVGFGSAAVLTSRLNLKATSGGRDLSGAYLLTTVIQRIGVDSWSIVSTHLSPLAAGN